MAINHMQNAGIAQWDEIYPDISVIEKDIAAGTMRLLKYTREILSAVVLNDHQDTEYESIEWKYSSGRVMVVHRLCVNPVRQGQGIGKITMEHIEALAKETGCVCLRLDAFCGNPAALRLYESLGYRRAGTVHFRTGNFICYEKLI